MSIIEDTHFLRATRQACSMTTEEAALLVHASRRSWEGWESGSRPIPQAKLDLLRSKLEGSQSSKKFNGLVVVIRNTQGWQEPIDVVSSEYFLGLEQVNDQYVIKSLAINPRTKRPYVHRTKFKHIDNEHVIQAALKWKSVAEAD